ncbi:hypothetical protein AMELA_G00283350, partial [Ameiurus melas]
MASDGGSVEPITPLDLQKNVKKEEIVDEVYLCEVLSDSVGHITPVDQQNHVKKEEPEDEPNFCDGTSNSMENVDENSGGFERKPVKKEESEDEDPCTTTDWDMDDAQVQFFSCSWCSFSYTSQIHLHKHIRRYHYEEYERLLQSGELKEVEHITAISSSIQQTSAITLNRNSPNKQMQ